MVEEDFLLEVLRQLSLRLEEIERRHAYLSFIIEKRLANEKLLQLETMHIISYMPDVVDYLPEKLYGPRYREKCDFWFKLRDRTEFWIEIKMRPTNYRKPGHAKAITNGVDQVIEDIRRLRQITKEKMRRFVMFAFYPIYAESYGIFNRIHLKRISEEIGEDIKRPAITVRVGEADFNVYAAEA